MKILLLFLGYRLIFTLLTRNYQYPDEYWQGPEVAHRLYYGYGYLTWEWTMTQPLRNSLYPRLLSLSYYLCECFGLHSFILSAPKLFIQMPLAAVTDYFVYLSVKFIYGKVTTSMILLIFGNWYYSATLTRTYFNSFQTSLTIIAFYFWLRHGQMGQSNKYDFMNRLISTISYVSRPTSLMMWALIWPWELLQIIRAFGIFSERALKFVIKNILNLVIMVMASVAMSYIHYGKVTCTELNFVKVDFVIFQYNFIEKWSQLYGKEHILFYFGLSIPFMMNIALVFIFLSILKLFIKKDSIKQQIIQKIDRIKLLTFVCIAYLLISSLSAHKEHRFIFPILPFLLILSVYCISSTKLFIFNWKVSYKIKNIIIFVYLIVNLCIFGLFSVYGKSDGITVWNHIGNQLQKMNLNEKQSVIIVMGESHFIPGVSHLHKNVIYKIPDSSALKMLLNQSQNLLLSKNPQQLYQILTQNQKLKPDFIIAQGQYLPYFANFIAQKQYEEVITYRHCTIPQETFIGYDSISVFEPVKRKRNNQIND